MTQEISIDIRKHAWDWVTRIHSKNATDEDVEKLVEWLMEDPSHLHAYNEYQQIAMDLDDLAVLPEGVALRESAAKGGSLLGAKLVQKVCALRAWLVRPQVGWALASIFAVVVVAIFTREPDPAVDTLTYQTQIGETRSLTLADGTTVTLGGYSHIKSMISKTERFVRLLNGEVFFDVATVSDTPFLVQVEDTVVRVIGTKFNINRSSRRIKISVFDGVVRVSGTEEKADRPEEQRQSIVLRQGQQVARSVKGELNEVTTFAVSDLESWRNGWLAYKSEPLVDVIADANRYFNGIIMLGDNSLAELPVTVSLRTEDIRALPDMLAATVPVVVVNESNNRIVLLPKDGDAVEQ